MLFLFHGNSTVCGDFLIYIILQLLRLLLSKVSTIKYYVRGTVQHSVWYGYELPSAGMFTPVVLMQGSLQIKILVVYSLRTIEDDQVKN
jgi:hypothetical protein